MTVLYDDGDFSRFIPYTFSVVVRKWEDDEDVDFILDTIRVTDEPSGGKAFFSGSVFYSCEFEKRALDVDSDGEAIREGVAEYYEVKKWQSEKMAEKENNNGK